MHAGRLPCGTLGHDVLSAPRRDASGDRPPDTCSGPCRCPWDGKECLRLVARAVVPCHGGRGWQVTLEQAPAAGCSDGLDVVSL